MAAALVAAVLVVAVIASVIISQHRFNTATREFARRTLTAQEEERAWVARELHDDIIQQIAILTHGLEELRQSNGPPEQTAQRVEEMGARLRELAGSVRLVAHRMHPSSLDHLGLPAALRGLAGDLARAEGMQVKVEAEEALEDLPPPVAIGLYRAAQEALRNVRKHAGTEAALVRAARTNGGVALEVIDHGRGFPVDGASKAPGLGLAAMRERAELLHGRMSVESQAGRGTRVLLWVPLGSESS